MILRRLLPLVLVERYVPGSLLKSLQGVEGYQDLLDTGAEGRLTRTESEIEKMMPQRNELFPPSKLFPVVGGDGETCLRPLWEQVVAWMEARQ